MIRITMLDVASAIGSLKGFADQSSFPCTFMIHFHSRPNRLVGFRRGLRRRRKPQYLSEDTCSDDAVGLVTGANAGRGQSRVRGQIQASAELRTESIHRSNSCRVTA